MRTHNPLKKLFKKAKKYVPLKITLDGEVYLEGQRMDIGLELDIKLAVIKQWEKNHTAISQTLNYLRYPEGSDQP